MRLRLVLVVVMLMSSGSARAGCISKTGDDVQHDAGQMWQGLRHLPRNAVKAENLKWELPIAAASAVLIGAVDVPASRRVRSDAVTEGNDRASSDLLDAQFAAVTLAFAVGCLSNHDPGREHARHAAFAALEAAGYAVVLDLGLKAATNREYPDKFRGDGRFWHGGKSFPAAHSAAAWGITAALAREYPNHRWVKWAGYGAAASVSLLRFPAKKHFPSDILAGSTLGYVVGAGIGTR